MRSPLFELMLVRFKNLTSDHNDPLSLAEVLTANSGVENPGVVTWV